jgi:ABC-type nitrate/sulfonate/bicarbonate transport system permease component
MRDVFATGADSMMLAGQASAGGRLAWTLASLTSLLAVWWLAAAGLDSRYLPGPVEVFALDVSGGRIG